MIDNPLISIVVPVYKVEKFLDRCVGSLVAQSYENIEIILVDDGSPDNCGAMCEAWAEKDSRIRVLHKENGGLSDARNRGVAIARGEYISFVDSDDYVSSDYVEYLLGLLRENDADISCGKFRIVHDEPEVFENQPEDKTRCFNNMEACRAYNGEHHMHMVTAWGKLFPAAVVKNNPFPVGRLHEDEACTYKYYHQAGKTVLGLREIYGYYQNTQSITHTMSRKRMEHALLSLEERCDYFKAAGEHELCARTAEQVLFSLVHLDKIDSNAELKHERAKAAEKYMNMGVRIRYRVFYRVYEKLGIDLNSLLLRLKGEK